MTSSSNHLRRAGLGLLAAATAVTSLAFTFSLNNNTGLPVKWPAGTVRLRLMLGDTPVLSDGSTYNSSVATAATTWNNRLGSVQFQTEVVAAGAPVDDNDLNEIGFAATYVGKAFGDNVLAVTTGYSIGNDRTEADIYFRSTESWDSYRGALRSAEDIQRVAIHELGHVLGLDHPDENGQNVNAIMNSIISNVDTLTDDDIQGGQSLYGPPGIPANDNFSNTFILTLTDTGTLTLKWVNTNATKESGEPSHATNGGPSQTANPGGRSVWWRWTPPLSGSATVDTRGSYFDTILGIYTGSTLSALSQVASNDDIDPGVVQASTVTFNVIGGTTYRIAVDGFNNNDAGGADSGGITLNLSYTSNGGTLPIITTQPASVAVNSGGNATFSVVATGTGTLTYQWLFNSNPIVGATSASYSITSATTAQAGTYAVTVTNPSGAVTSNGATLSVNTPPPPPPPSSGGGGGGGGAPSLWFCAALAALGATRWWRQRR